MTNKRIFGRADYDSMKISAETKRNIYRKLSSGMIVLASNAANRLVPAIAG